MYGTDVNTGAVVQQRALLQALWAQQNGSQQLTTVDFSNNDSVFQRLTARPVDQLAGDLGQVVGKTIINSRSYTPRRYTSIIKTAEQYGGLTRWIDFIDTSPADSKRYGLVDGQTYSPFVYKPVKALELACAGATAWQYCHSVEEEQLRSAFRSPTELASFYGGIMAKVGKDKSVHEEQNLTALVCDLIAGTLQGGKATQQVHLLTEYNAKTGLELDANSVFQPENFRGFILWLIPRIEKLHDLLAEENYIFHRDLTGAPISRSTAPDKAIAYFNSFFLSLVSAHKADIYHRDALRLVTTEAIPYWQSATEGEEMSVLCAPTLVDWATGKKVAGESARYDNVLGVIFDKDAVGQNTLLKKASSTGVVPGHGFATYYYDFVSQQWLNRTQNCVVLLLD